VSTTPLVSSPLPPLDEALWRAAERDVPPGQERQILRDAVAETDSTLTTWVLLSNDAVSGRTAALDRLARMPGVADVRWIGRARAYLVRERPDPCVFVVAPSSRDGVLMLVTSVTPTDGRWKRLRRWIARGGSALSPVYLNEADFLALGDALAEFAPVAASRLTARDLSDGSSYTRGWPEQRRRPRPSHREALAEARNLAVRTLTLHVGDLLLVQLRREAGATFYSGDYDLFETVVFRGLEDAAARRRLLLMGRERRLHEPLPRPLVVRTGSPTFSSPEAVTDLLDSLERQEATSVALFHRNPYLHVAVTDYSDGSNFDVFVNRADEVVVIPGYRATVTALARLTDTVGERFAAIEVDEASGRSAPTLDELLGD
jgi:hypothetical protein